VLRLIALVVPLALDSFAVAAALSLSGLSRSERIRISIVFPAAEIVMPLIGLAAGRGLATAIGDGADYTAAAVLILLGALMFVERGEDSPERIRRARGIGLALAAVGISLDELALGIAIGLLRLSLVLALVLIAVQAVAATQIGLAVGARMHAMSPSVAARAAGVALIVIGLVLVTVNA
jgi:putative Mn2+ efflux pump MntP